MNLLIVKSYSGSRAEEYPVRFAINNHDLEVRKITDRWLTPGRRCFKVLADDGKSYTLEYDEVHDSWSLITACTP
jgi:hypothetical protein